MTGGERGTGERVVPEDVRSAEDHVLFLRHSFAYRYAEQRLSPHATVLDVGAGEGYGAARLAQGGRRGVAIDVDLGVAKRAARRGAGGCHFALGEGDRLPFAAESFDAAVSFQVIEHIENDRRFVLEMARVVRRRGTVLLTTPNRNLRLAPGERPWNRFHRREYGHQDLRLLLRQAFATVEILGISASPAVRELESRRLRRIRRLVSLDPSALRRRLPPKALTALRSVIGWFRRTGTDAASWRARYSEEDFFVDAASPETALDLLAICGDPEPQR